jgi:membrane protease YdiL (CAAX protease family)
MPQAKTMNWKLFTILLIASVASAVAAMPYTFYLYDLISLELPVPIPVAVLATVLQSAIFFGLSILIGLHLGNRTNLGAPLLEAWLNKKPIEKLGSILTLSCFIGASLGTLLFVLDRYAFGYFIEPITVFQSTPPVWTRIFVSFYGGIAEEILMRLFLTTLLVWLFGRLTRSVNSTLHIWAAIVIVSVIFGLGHLPMTARFIELTTFVVTRAIVLNGIAGVAFGWLYWRKGLASAMFAHFVTDIVLHVAMPLVL